MHNFVCGTADWAMCSAHGTRVQLLYPDMVTPSVVPVIGLGMYCTQVCCVCICTSHHMATKVPANLVPIHHFC